MNYIITDGHGYWCGMRRKADGTPVTFWSSKRKDAARIHFREVAESLTKHIPQPVEIKAVRK